MNPISKKLEPLLRQRVGPQTADLVLHPGEFGLGRIPARLEPDDVTTIVCGYCSTGCGLTAHLRDGQAINLSADTEYPVNLGMACPKGWEALTPLRAPDRATTPLLRNPDTGRLEPCDWERALVLFCEKFKEIKARHGPESVAFLSTGQIPTEEMALLGALFKFGMGFIHCDSNTRQCMATAHVAYKQSFGFDAPPYTYADFEQSDVLVFVGSNLCIAHPIMWQRVLRNQHQPEIIVVDPRKTETAMAATQHYANKPKSDLVLLYGLANILIANGSIDRAYIDAHTTGFVEFAEFVRAFPIERVSAATGLSNAEISRFADTIARGKRVSFWWTMGVNQSHEGTRTAQAIINLALITGNIGRPGTGANSVTGQCNAMGSRVFGNITSLLGGHDVNSEPDRAKIARILGLDQAVIPRQQAMAYDEIVAAIDAGKIKGLWVIATNSSHSWIHQAAFNDILKKLDFLVVQDLYHTTETAQRADLVLPAAGWGEKEGTFINSERRFGLLKKISRAPGQALSDFNIFRLIAQYWGCGEMFARWTSPEAAFRLLAEISRDQPLDFTGIGDYATIDRRGGVQWPWSEKDEGGRVEHEAADAAPSPSLQERRLFEDGRFFTTDGRAKIIFEEPRPMQDLTDAEFPFMLLTGRGTSSQWHTQTRTAKSDVLRHLYPAECYVEINPQDAHALGLEAGGKARLVSRQGEARVTAFVTPTVQPGQLFMPMHYRETNQLTFPAFDPVLKAAGLQIVRGARGGAGVTILRIYISPGHNFFGHHGRPPGENPVVELSRARCLRARGIEGDRFCDYKMDYRGQITFFAEEVYAELRERCGVHDVSPAAFRRNVVTRNVDLNALIGQEFEVQGVRFFGTEECRPCAWMNQAFHPQAEALLRGRGGLRARILSDGWIEAAEDFVPTESACAVMR